MDIINHVSNVFSNYCNYKTINELSPVKMRNKSDGIQIKDGVLYRFLYSRIGSTKEDVVSDINDLNDTSFTRQAFDRKENNIPLEFYSLLFNEISSILNNQSTTIGLSLVAVDGVCNNNRKRNVLTNLGIFDISKNIPIDIGFYGANNRNNEVKKFKQYLLSNLDKFKTAIFVCDRLYFNYQLIEFFLEHNFKFIVRIKGSGSNLDSLTPLKKGTPNYAIINRIRSKIRVVTCKKSYLKTVIISKRKTKRDVRKIMVRTDCMLVTNLTNKREYSDAKLLEYYRERWDIEIFFKLLKNNFKFQHLDEKSDINHQKLYYCELIITFILKAIEKYYWKDKVPAKFILKRTGKQVECVESINKSNTVNNIFKQLLDKIIYGTINKKILDTFCKRHIVKIKVEKGRSFPRQSNTSFTKWHIKGYSDISKYNQLISAIENGTIGKLNKNLKVNAKNITLIENG